MNVDKYIEGIREKVEKIIESLRTEANEAYMNWADTGYQKYMTKKERLEKDADKLESFIHPEYDMEAMLKRINGVKNENERLRLLLKSVQNVLEIDMLYDFPDCSATRRLENIVNEFKYEF